MATADNSSGAFAALRQRNFGLYAAGSTVSLIGMWVQRIAIGWLTWDLTHSGTWLGLIAFADLFPIVVLTPLAGLVADRYDRLKITILSQYLASAQALLLAFLTFTGDITIWWLVVLSAFIGVVWAFNTAARLSMIPNLVEHRYIASAVALNSAAFNAARFIGPALAGGIMAIWGVGEAFLFNAATFVVFIVALMKMRLINVETSGRSRGGMLSQSFNGIGYARRHPGIGPILVLLFAMAIGVKPMLELLPGFADAVFHRGIEGLAQLTASAGLGALITAVWLAQRGRMVGLTNIALLALIASAITILAFTASDWYPLGLVACFVFGITITMAGTATQSLMQNAVEGHMRGQVMSLYGLVYRGGPAVGALIMGAAADLVGLQWALASGAVICMAAWIWLARQRIAVTQALEHPPQNTDPRYESR
ncbi:MAG: MFS transporter [Alphaproteobacteria bacterium]